MRLLYVSATTGVHDARFVRAWHDADVDIDVLVLSTRDRSDLEAKLASFRPDVVQAGPITTVAREVIDVWAGPLIATSWGFDLMHDAPRSASDAAAAREVLSRATVVLADNDAVAAQAVDLGADGSRIVSFPWGVDHERFRPAGGDLRAELGLHGARVILSVRRHEEVYDVETLIRAFPAVAARFPEARLVVGGSGSLTGHLEDAASRSGARARIRFVGEREGAALAELYRTADVYVSTSLTDGSSISLLEAMACGLVPVVADIPGNRQWVDDAAGMRFRPGDADSLAEALSRVLDDPDAAQARAAVSRDRVRTHADWARGPELLLDAARRAADAGETER